MMTGLVKLYELEEVAEPPLGGLPEVSTSRLPRDDTQDLDADDVMMDDDGEEARFSPGESQLGLL